MATTDFVPRGPNEGNIGTILKPWLKGWFKDVFVGQNLTDGTKSLPVSDIVQHSLAQADNDVMVGDGTNKKWIKKTLAEFRASLGLGSAAYVNTGANANQIPLRDSNGLAPGEFPSGTSLIFPQATAPVGWTKSTTHNDKALRVVSGTTGGQEGGSIAFSSVFGRVQTDATTLSTAQMPPHPHGISNMYVWAGEINSGGRNWCMPFNGNHLGMSTDSAGGGGSHYHGIDIRVQYVDCIICTKD